MELSINPIHQGKTNGCGTAALAMALNCLKPSQRFTQAMLDTDFRRFNSFSAPQTLIQAAKVHGFHAALYHPVALPDILAHLDAGHPVLALHSVDGTIPGLHYALIAGYERDETAEGTRLILWDPAPASGQRKVILYKDFMTRFWQPVTWMGQPLGLNRIIIAVSRQDDLPPGSPVPWPLRAAYVVNRAINLLGRAIYPVQTSSDAI